MLTARVLQAHPLRYDDGPDAALDRPPLVRAGSALVPWRDALWVIQDDARFLAEVQLHPHPLRVRAHTLPPAADGRRLHGDDRGTKHLKSDFEAAFLLDDTLVVLGSGSGPNRRHLLLVHPDRAPQLVDAAPLYEHLRATSSFAGAELNVEGAALLGDHLVLANRGNGRPTADLPAVDALGYLPLDAVRRALHGGPWPTLARTQRVHLPDGLTLTDLAAHNGQLWFLAVAEDSPDAWNDGPVTAVALGHLHGETPVLTNIIGLDHAVHGKPEGLALLAQDRAFLVTDPDSVDQPAWLLEVELGGV